MNVKTVATHTPNEVKIVGFDMPFISLVGFMLKCMFAVIPAVILYWVAWVTVGAGVAAMLVG